MAGSTESVFQPEFRRARVGVQAFAVCQYAGDFAQFLRALFGDLDQAGAFLEVVSAQRRREAGGAAGGQDVVGAGAIVAEAFAGVAPHENRAGVADFFCPFLRVFYRQFQVFGGNVVGDFAGFVQVFGEYHRAPVAERGFDDVAAGHGFDEAVHSGLYFVEIGLRRADEDSLCDFVVFGLAEQIHRYPISGRGAVGDDEDFRRPRHHVDANYAEHAAFGGGDEGVARAGDFIDLRYGLGAVGEGGNRLRAADGEDFGNARDEGGGKYDVVAFALGCGDDHDDFFHAGNMGGHGVHDDGTRIRRFAAGDVNADAVKWCNLLSQQRAVFVFVRPRFHFLALVVAFNACGGGFQGGLNFGLQTLERCLQIVLGEDEVGYGLGGRAVEAVGVFDERRIATFLHVGADIGDDAVDFGILRGFKSQQGFEFGLERGGLGGQFFHGVSGVVDGVAD